MKKVLRIWLLSGAVALALLPTFGLTVIDDVKPGATPIDTLGIVRERIYAARAKDAKEKIVLNLDFGLALNAEMAKFANGRTVFWRGTNTLTATKAQAEAASDAPRSTVGKDLLVYRWWRERLAEKERERQAISDTVDLVLIGDSITHWWERSGDGTVGAYDKLTDEFTVRNLGLCGDRTENVIWRLENGELDGYRAKTVMIMIGTNNGGDSEADVADGVKRIVEIVRTKQPQAKVLLVAVFPRHVESDHPGRLRIREINALLEKLCDNESVKWIDFGYKYLAPDGTLPKAMMHDTLHPTPAGYKVWYDAVLPWLRAAIPEGGAAKRGEKLAAVSKPETAISRILAKPMMKPDCFKPSGRMDYGAYQGFDWWVGEMTDNRRAIERLKDKDLDIVLFGATLVKNWTRGTRQFGGKDALEKLFEGRKGLVLALDEDRMENTIWRAVNGELDGFTAKWIVLSTGERNWYDSPEELAKGTAELLRIVREKHPESKIIVMGMFPQGSYRSPVMEEINVQQRAVNERIKKLDNGKDVFFLDISNRLRLDNGDTDPEMMPKDIHPSPKTYNFWRREIERVMHGAQLAIAPDQRWRNLPWDDVPVLLYVSPDGDDSAAGTRAAPLKTLAGARDCIRKLKAGRDGKLPGGVIVTLLAGEYLFSDPVAFTAEDSGTPETPILYRSERTGAAVFSGAMRPDWKLNPATGLYEATIPGKKPIPGFFGSGCCTRDTQFYIEHPVQLYQDGERLTCARWPNKDTCAQIKECYADAEDLGADTTWAERFRTGMISIMDGDGNVKDLTALSKEKDVWAWGIWFTHYADATAKLTGFDLRRNAFRFDDRLVKHGWRRKAECYVFNALSELDEPGEWVIDRAARKLYVKPLAGKAEMPVIALTSSIIKAEGLHDVSFDGITFECARETVVNLKDCRDVKVRTATFRHTASNAVTINGGTDCLIQGCDMYDLGKGGVWMRGGSMYTLNACNHTTDNCHIYDFGKVTYNYQPAISLNGTGCRATHNLIHHTRHQGIAFHGNVHYVGFNVLHDLCMYNGDAGAIYAYHTTGAWNMRGNVVEYNLIHMVGDQPRGYMCDGIYLDAFVTGTTVRGNLINRATNGCFSSGGQDNRFFENIVMRCAHSIRKWNLGNGRHPCSQLGADSYVRYPLVHNRELFELSLWKDRFPNMLKPLDMPEPKFAGSSLFVNISSNALVATSRIICVDKGSYYDDSETGPYTTIEGNLSYDGDPGFIDYAGGNWELRADSPLRQVWGHGTRFAEMGLYDSAFRVSKAVKYGAGMSQIRKLKREFTAAQAWIELFWKGDLPDGVTECSTDRAGCEYLAWGTKGKVILANYGRVPHDRWQTYRFAFTPTADGEFKFEVAGAWGEKTRYDDFIVTGAELANGDFSTSEGWCVPPPVKDQGTYDREQLDDSETFGDVSVPYGIVDGTGVANQFRRLVQQLRVKKGERVTVTFKARGFDDPADDF